MKNLEFFNNITDAVCAFNRKNELVFKNKSFTSLFSDFSTTERFKKRFNFNLCFLKSENITNMLPLDILLQSKEDFHTVCTYQNLNGEYLTFYISKFEEHGNKIVVFKDISSQISLDDLQIRYNDISRKYEAEKQSTEKFLKLQEHAQSQVLKMGIVNRISLVIRETNDIESVLKSALTEINNLLGSYKTYFSVREKNGFRIRYIIGGNNDELNSFTNYEQEVINGIKNKNIVVTSCLKEYLNSENILKTSVNRIIIPVYNKNKLIGIIVTLTRQRFQTEENKEILQSVSVQLGSTIIQSGLIQQLNKKNKKLQKTLSELKETQLQLINSEKMATIGQLVSGVAHEINTPLASINSNNLLANKILNSDVTKDKSKILKELNEIDSVAAKRISDMVKSLKRFVRLDEAEFQKADINKELDLTLKLIAHELKDNITVEKHYGKIPAVLCSVNMLNQVFMNILINACHAISEKEGKGKIIITTGIEKNNLTVTIEDNGCGIPKEVTDKIFNTGFTTKKAGLGTGLGLSISKKIIEMHKGSISFTSVPDKGSTFKVIIPAQIQQKEG